AATRPASVFISPHAPALLPTPPPTPRSDSRDTITVLSLGAVGSSLLASVWPALRAQLPLKALLAVGEYNESSSEQSQNYGISGVLDVSPSAREIATAQRKAVSGTDFRHKLLEGMMGRVRQALITVDAMAGQVIILTGPEVLDAEVEGLLADLKRRRPEQEILLITCNLWLDAADPRVREVDLMLEKMHQDGTLTAAIPLNAKRKEDARQAGVAVASLIGAQLYDLGNPSLVGVAKRLAAKTPFLELRTDCRDVDATLPIEGPVFARRKPVVSSQDAASQAQYMTKALLQPDKVGVLVYTVPLGPRDMLWARFCDAMRTWLDEQAHATGRQAMMPVFMPGRQLEVHVAALSPRVEVLALATPTKKAAETSTETREDLAYHTDALAASSVVEAMPASANGHRPASHGRN
ncbi:MAG: hypothetical protein IVW57_17570, partial [Ktedonobacterales bacterium]|nr:hypothetical protein [Ktedonobacterales bacterium]